jgi:hypothetical protein
VLHELAISVVDEDALPARPVIGARERAEQASAGTAA